MRIGLIGASLCLCLVGISHAQNAHASIRKDLNVPAEDLSPALQTVATTYEFQVLYPTSIVKDLKTSGAVGSLTSDEALKKVLSGTGLTYKFLDSNTITVYAASAPAATGPAADPGQTTQKTAKEGQNNSNSFRVAQVDQGKGSNAIAVANQTSSQENSNAPSVGLSEIIVTAQKRSERLQDVPISITVLGGAELDRSNFASAADALATVPGIATVANQYGGATQITLRGVAGANIVDGGSSPVAYYVDSVPFGFVRQPFLPDPNVYDLQQIEVLRGPQGTLYGANALNGVVRVLTNDPNLHEFDFKARTALSTTETGAENYGGDMAVNVPIVDGVLAARVVLGDQHFSGWIDGPLGTHLNDGEQSNVRLKVAAQPGEGLSIGLSAWHSQTKTGAPPYSDDNREITALHPQPDSASFNAYGLKVMDEFSSFSISSMSSYLDYSDLGVVDGGPFGFPVTLTHIYGSRVYSEEFNILSKLTGPWRWSAGAFYRDDRDTDYGFLTPLLAPESGYTDLSKSAAVYGEVGRRFLDNKLEISAGLRYFHDDATTQALPPVPSGVPSDAFKATSKATTPRAVITWTPAPNETYYASYSQGFRSGYAQQPGVYAAVPSIAPVKPDKLTNYELGTKGTLLDQRISYDLSVYYMDWRNIQETIGIPVGDVFDTAQVNGQSASGVGTDVAISANVIGGLSITANFSWNNLKLDEAVMSGGVILFSKGERPAFSPEFTAGAGIRYAFPLGSGGFTGELAASGNYTSTMDNVQLNGPVRGVGEGDNMFLARSSLSINSPEHWTLGLFVENLTNTYNSPVKSANIPPISEWDLRVRPRTIGVRLDYRLR